MSTIHLDNKQGTQTLERADHDLVQCIRCGIWRKARPTSTLCQDCRTVETHTNRLQPAPIEGGTWTRRAGVWRWTPNPEPLSAEDRAWCEKAAEKGFWRQWEQLNRADAVTPALMQKARELSREMPQPRVENRTPSDQQFSTRPVDNDLHKTGERVFDESATTTKEGAA